MLKQIFEDLKTDLIRLQKKRKLASLAQKITWSLTGLFFIFMLVQLAWPMDSTLFGTNFSIGAIAFITILQVIVLIFVKLHKTFKEEEESIITKMSRNLFPDFKFYPTHYLPKHELIRSQIFENNSTTTSYYGYLTGKVHQVPFHIADIGLIEHNAKRKFQNIVLRIPYLGLLVILYEYVLKNLISNKSADTVHHSFRGMFCWTDFNKEIKGLTLVLPDKLEARYGNLAKMIQGLSQRGQLVNLEDARFENEFVVYSTDQIEARYILSAAVMEKLYELKLKFSLPIMLSFYQNKIYLAVQLQHGLFAFNPSDLTSQRVIENIYREIGLALQMVRDLNLHINLSTSPYK